MFIVQGIERIPRRGKRQDGPRIQRGRQLFQNSFVDSLHTGQQILDKWLEPGGVRLLVEWQAGILIPVEHKWQTINHDISSQDLKEMVLEVTKGISVKLK